MKFWLDFSSCLHFLLPSVQRVTNNFISGSVNYNLLITENPCSINEHNFHSRINKSRLDKSKRPIRAQPTINNMLVTFKWDENFLAIKLSKDYLLCFRKHILVSSNSFSMSLCESVLCSLASQTFIKFFLLPILTKYRRPFLLES